MSTDVAVLLVAAMVGTAALLQAEYFSLSRKVDQMAVTQDGVKQLLDSLTGSVKGLSADVAALKAAVTPGEPMSQEAFDQLSAIAASLAALDAETPETPTEPAA